MSWIVPENKLDPIQRAIVDDNPIHNLCIKGIARTGKTVVLFHLMRKVMLSEKNARCVLLVFNNLAVEKYHSACDELGVRFELNTYYRFKKSTQSYDYIFCDNVQDISSGTLIEIKNRAKIVIVTLDPYITLFQTDPLTNEPTLTTNDVEKILRPKIFELVFFHFCSPAIQQLLSRMLKVNLYPERKDVTRVATQIRLCKAHNEEEEFLYIKRTTTRSLIVGRSNAVLMPTNNMILSFIQGWLSLTDKQPWSVQTNNWGKTDYSSLNCYLEENNIPIQCLGNGYGHINDCNSKISILTYYSSQGLVFDDVFIPNMNTNMFISSNEQISRNAIALAVTRCHDNLYITYNGIPHEYLNDVETDCSKIDIHEALSTIPFKNVFAEFNVNKI